MKNGTIKFFNPGKGFGFIAPEDGSDDVFVHINQVKNSGLKAEDLQPRTAVVYEDENGRKGPQVTTIGLA